MAALFSSDELSHAAGGVMTRPFHADGVSIDTRTLKPGDLFVALVGENGDGHNFVADALAKGASGALVHRQEGLPDDAPLLAVGDTLAGLASIGAYARERFEGSVIAVTGSVGKTTTKEMLRTILSAFGNTHAAEASYNNHWGVPLTLARMPAGFDYAVLEIGMNHPGEIAPLARLAGPDVAIITAIEATHIGHMGSLDAIAAEKAAILEGVLQGGTLVVPEGEARLVPHISRFAHIKVAAFGKETICDLAEDADGSTVTAHIAGKDVAFRLGVPGRHMVSNALAALTGVAALGLDLQQAGTALEQFVPVSGRGVRSPILDGQATLLDESYNASGASVRAALSVLRLLPAKRRIAVLGDMLELGDHSAREHESLADALCESADLLYACGPWMKLLYDAIPPQRRGAYAEDSAAIASLVSRDVVAGDVVLVKGSLGSRMRVVADALRAQRLPQAEGG